MKKRKAERVSKYPRMSFKTVLLLILASSLSAGILLVLLSCILTSSWLPLPTVLFYMAAPLPNIASRTLIHSHSSDSDDEILVLSYFTTSILVVSGIGLPLVLWLVDRITMAAGLLSSGGGILIYVSVVAYIKCFQTEDQY